jgi:hypothetical protein
MACLGIDLAKAGGVRYRDIGSGMGASDERLHGQRSRHLAELCYEGDLTVLVESDPQLLNRHDVILPRSWSGAIRTFSVFHWDRGFESGLLLAGQYPH